MNQKVVADAAAKVMVLMRERPGAHWFATEIQEETGISWVSVYAALAILEQGKLVESGWQPGTYPRRRFYKWAGGGTRINTSAPAFDGE